MYTCSVVQIVVPGVGWAHNDRLTVYIGIDRETSIKIPFLPNHLVIKTETCVKASSDILDGRGFFFQIAIQSLHIDIHTYIIYS